MALSSEDELRKLVDSPKIDPGKYQPIKERIVQMVKAEPELAVAAWAVAAASPPNGYARRLAYEAAFAAAKQPLGPWVVGEIGRTVTLDDSLIRELASLAGAMGPIAIDTILTTTNGTEFALDFAFAVAQEGLIRYRHMGAPGKLVHEQAVAAGHPGKWLPAELHDHEADLGYWLASYGAFRGQRLPRITPPRERVGEHNSVFFGDVLDRYELQTTGSIAEPACDLAFRRMVTHSGGQIELASFGPKDSSGPNPARLLAVGHDTLVVPAEPHHVIETFFSAARCPGAYTQDVTAWEARLAAGRCAAGWVGADSDASYLSVLDNLDKLDWFFPDTSGEWFDHIAWDYAVLAVNDESGLLLTATDTD